jgi:hypothetical protein
MGDLEFSCGALGRAAMTALTDQGLGLGTDDVCDMALAAAMAMTVKTLVGEGNCYLGNSNCVPGTVFSPILTPTQRLLFMLLDHLWRCEYNTLPRE